MYCNGFGLNKKLTKKELEKINKDLIIENGVLWLLLQRKNHQLLTKEAESEIAEMKKEIERKKEN